VKSGSRGVQQNLVCNFWTLLQVFTNFGSLNYFLPFKIFRKTINKHHTVSSLKPAHGLQCMGENGPWAATRRLATRGRLTSRLGPGLAARSSRRGGPRCEGMGRMPCLLTVRSLRLARACAGVVTRLTAVRWGLASGKVLSTSTSGVPGWRRAGGVQAGLPLAMAQRAGAERGVGTGAVDGIRGEGALVSGGAVDGRRGRELQVRCQDGEEELRHKVESSNDSGGVPFF
jgi:hypothetical protein